MDEKGWENKQEYLGKDRPEREKNDKGRSWKVARNRGRKMAFNGQKRWAGKMRVTRKD